VLKNANGINPVKHKEDKRFLLMREEVYPVQAKKTIMIMP
jgi:hypothetical protein